MKKIISILVIITNFLFANSTIIFDLKYNKDFLGYGGVYINEKDKTIFLTYYYNQETKKITNSLIKETLKELENMVCKNTFKNYIKNGYQFIITYIYANHKVVQTVINQCPK